MSLIVPMVGMHFTPPAKMVLALLASGTSFSLQPEPDNPYDGEAIKVFLNVAELFATSLLDQEELDAALQGSGFDYEEVLANPALPMGHVGATGRGPCMKLALPGTTEVHALVGEGVWEDFEGLLGFTPAGVPTLTIQRRA